MTVSYYTADGSAVEGDDYYRNGSPANPRTATIEVGQTQTYAFVYVFADNLDEVGAHEYFTVVVSSVSGDDATLGPNRAGRVEIVDSDPQQQLPILWVTSSSVVEGDSATRIAQVKIELSRPAAGLVVSYESVDSGALAGSDYTAKFPGTVVFGAGQTSKSLGLLVNSDLQYEQEQGVERIGIRVNVVGGPPVLDLRTDGFISIVDDDPRPPDCEPGTFSSPFGYEPCMPAPPGFFVDTQGATSATPCAPGSYQDEEGSLSASSPRSAVTSRRPVRRRSRLARRTPPQHPKGRHRGGLHSSRDSPRGGCFQRCDARPCPGRVLRDPAH